IGRWPREPGLAARCSVTDLPVAAGAPLLGVLRDGLGCTTREEFLVEADAGLSPVLGGTFDDESFTTKVNTLLGPCCVRLGSCCVRWAHGNASAAARYRVPGAVSSALGPGHWVHGLSAGEHERGSHRMADSSAQAEWPPVPE